MKFPRTDYLLATSLEDAFEMLELGGARILAGGQSLLALMAFRLSRPDVLVDVSRLAELQGIEIDTRTSAAESLVIGAGVAHAEIECNPVVASALPCLAAAARHIGHPAIRNVGTIGGSIAHADPAAEWPAMCIALGAQAEIASAGGSRREAVEDVIAGPYQTTLREGEIVVRLRFPLVAHRRVGFAEVARRLGDFALAGAVCTLDAGSPRADAAAAVTFFGVEGEPRRVELPLPASQSSRGGDDFRRAVETTVLPCLRNVLEDNQADADFRRHLALVVATRSYCHATRTAGEQVSAG